MINDENKYETRYTNLPILAIWFYKNDVNFESNVDICNVGKWNIMNDVPI